MSKAPSYSLKITVYGCTEVCWTWLVVRKVPEGLLRWLNPVEGVFPPEGYITADKWSMEVKNVDMGYLPWYLWL